MCDSEAFISNFNSFFSATTVESCLEHFSNMCLNLQLSQESPGQFLEKAKLNMKDSRLFRLKSLIQKFDKRSSSNAYSGCRDSPLKKARVLIIGSGPAGLRTAIECFFLGCRDVVVIEKRAEFTRNNIVHLWAFVIRDLIELGTKIFFPKFCTGDLNHISIKLLQFILLKISLLLGVRFFPSCKFVSLDSENCSPTFSPSDHKLSGEIFDVIVGASGARSALPGFLFAEDRRALAIGITANFKNKNTLPEQQACEISGVARQFNAQFFDELNSYSGIDIENLVYYKGDTHYFVCTARKASLLMKGALVNDLPETDRLLAKSNVSQFNLCKYMKELANVCTAMTIPDLEYESIDSVEDTAIFDFTSSTYAKHSCRAIVKPDGRKLLLCLVGDSLRLPFWPEGTGCPRGFLSSYDTAWLIQNWFCSALSPVECIALRECVYGLYSSTKPDVLYKNFTELERFHLDPQTRYRQLDLSTAHVHLQKAKALIEGVVVIPDAPFSVPYNNTRSTAVNSKHMNGRKRNEAPRNLSGSLPDRLYKWCISRLRPYNELLPGLENELTFFDGMALCCLLHSIRSSAIDLFAITPGPLAVETFLNAVFREFTIVPQLTAEELMSGSNHNALVRVLLQLYSLTTSAEKAAAASDEKKKLTVAEKAEKLKEMGRGIRQQRKHQLAVEHLLFGEKNLSLEEKKMKLKELFLLGQANGGGNGSPNAASEVGSGLCQDFEERRSRLKDLLQADASGSGREPSDAKVFETSESIRDKRDVLVRKFQGDSAIPLGGNFGTVSPTKISSLLYSTSTAPKKLQMPEISDVDVSKRTKKLLTSLSSTCITDEQKRIAAALFEARLKGQQRRNKTNDKEDLSKGPPPARLTTHLSVGDRMKQLLSNSTAGSAKSAKPTPDESAHIPVLEMKERLGIACDSHASQRSFDPVEKSQMPITELAKRIASSTSHQQPDRKSEVQIVNQDYQPCCYICCDRLYVTERMQVGQYAVHRDCFRCTICRRLLRWSNYSAVDTRNTKRTIFVCPSHIENDELQEYLSRPSGLAENSMKVTVVSKKSSVTACASSSEEKHDGNNVDQFLKTASGKYKNGSDNDDSLSDEEVYLEDEEDDDLDDSDEEALEDDEDEFMELEDIVSDGVDFEDFSKSTPSTNEELDRESEKMLSVSSVRQGEETEQAVELKSAVKIDSWLHAQVVQQRQQKLALAKQAFLSSAEPPSLPLPISPELRNEGNTRISNGEELVMECDSDNAADEKSKDTATIKSDGKADADLSEMKQLAQDCRELKISSSVPACKEVDKSLPSPSHENFGNSSVRNMFSKLQNSLSMLGSKSRSSTWSRNSLPSSSPNSPMELLSPGQQLVKSSSGSDEDSHGEQPKWRRIASSIFSGQPKRKKSPSKAKPRNRPDSVDVMLFGSDSQAVASDGNRKTDTTEDEQTSSCDNTRRALVKLVECEETQANNPVLVKDALKLIADIDRLDSERRHLDDVVSCFEDPSQQQGQEVTGAENEDSESLLEVVQRRNEVLNLFSEVLLKSKILEIEANLDDLTRKYISATQGSTDNVDDSPEKIMHQMAVLAGTRDSLTEQLVTKPIQSKLVTTGATVSSIGTI